MNCDSIAGVGGDLAVPAPPMPHRRPRVREVSSRFMSPAPPSASAMSIAAKSPLSKPSSSNRSSPDVRQQQQRLLKTMPRPRRSQEHEPLSCCAHENIPETIRSLDTPLPIHRSTAAATTGTTTLRKQRAVVKLFKERGTADQVSSSSSLLVGNNATNTGKPSFRPLDGNSTNTPNCCAQTNDRIVPSRFRLPTPNSCRQSNSSTAAAKLLHSIGLSSSSSTAEFLDVAASARPSSTGSHDGSDVNDIDAINGGGGGGCGDTLTVVGGSHNLNAMQLSMHPNSPTPHKNGRTTWSFADMRFSVPEGDMLPTRLLAAAESISCNNSGNSQTSKFPPSPCSRSLNFPPSSCVERSRLPPQPTHVRPGANTRKGRKLLTSQEDVHSLKMLHNHYLQWRFANAKAEASMHAQRKESKSQLHSCAAAISELRAAMNRKRIEVELLQRTKSLSTILQTHLPYLDEWSALEEDYSESLSGVSHALVNSLLRLPLSGNVQVNLKEIDEAMHSAIMTMEMINVYIQSFIPKAGDMDALISEVARVIGGERALVEECGNLLFKAYTSQVEDCSLRGHLMQLQCGNYLL